MLLTGYTETPGVTIRLKQITLNVDTDDDFLFFTNDPDVYTLYSGTHVRIGKDNINAVGRCPTGDGSDAYHVIAPGGTKEYNVDAFVIPKIGKDDRISFNVTSIDVDDADSYKKVGYVVAGLIVVVAGLALLGVIGGGMVLAKELANLALSIIKVDWGSNDDDLLAHYDWVFGRGTLWGTTPEVQKDVVGEAGGVTYTIECTLNDE